MQDISARTLEYYENNAASLAKRYEQADMTQLHNLLLEVFEQNDILLEIGCGSGRDAAFLHKNGYNVIAIDNSSQMIEEAKKNHPKIKENLFVKNLPDQLEFDKCFDGIYSIATLMHFPIEQLKDTLSKIYDLLKEKGKFIISVSLKRDDVNEKGFDEHGRYFLQLNQDEWTNLFEKVGFEVKKIQINKDGLDRNSIEWLTLILKK